MPPCWPVPGVSGCEVSRMMKVHLASSSRQEACMTYSSSMLKGSDSVKSGSFALPRRVSAHLLYVSTWCERYGTSLQRVPVSVKFALSNIVRPSLGSRLIPSGERVEDRVKVRIGSVGRWWSQSGWPHVSMHVAAASVQRGKSIPSPGPDVLNKHQHQVL
ncbi:hypothetical protein HaLaN_10896, partial [Haematococcus lacustris]